MQLTTSELLFESFCGLRGIAFHRIETTTEQRPDYEIELAGKVVLVEVKQCDPNDEELSGSRALGGKPGERLRAHIHSANRQLKALLDARGEQLSTLLVVYNNSRCALHTKSYAVATAMEGLDEIPVEVPPDPAERPLFGTAQFSGKGRQMHAGKHTTTSAIGILSVPDDEPHMLVYHNRFASRPFDADSLRGPNVMHARWREGATSSLDDPWVLF